MRIFLAGATGVVGRRLVPLLVEAGHQVVGMTRSPDKASALRELGADPVVCDVYDRAGLTRAVQAAAPEVVVQQLTDLPDDAARVPEFGAANSRIRTEGTRNLLEAAKAAGAQRFIAQSVAWTIPGRGGAAVEELERMVIEAGGVVVRYGQFYGPGTYHPNEAAVPPGPRVHIDDAARRTLEALSTSSTVLTIVDE